MEREDYGMRSGGLEPSRRLENLGAKADRMAEDVAEKAERLTEKASTAVEGAKEQASVAYEQTRDLLGRSCERVLEYGRQKPGTAILLGFGAGALVGMIYTRDRRRGSLVPAVATALAAALYDFADRV